MAARPWGQRSSLEARDASGARGAPRSQRTAPVASFNDTPGDQAAPRRAPLFAGGLNRDPKSPAATPYTSSILEILILKPKIIYHPSFVRVLSLPRLLNTSCELARLRERPEQ